MHDTTQSTILTPSFINENMGKVITWYAFGYKGNFPMKGKCKLLGTTIDKRDRTVPLIEHIAGDNLSYAWLEDGEFNYSDSGRLVHVGEIFELYNIIYDVPKFGYLKSTGNPMHLGMVHWLGNDINEEIKRATTATEYELQLIV